jgi:hypothetical protein
MWPLCLDWREICDGKNDCSNGEDEELCDQLEMVAGLTSPTLKILIDHLKIDL